MPIYLFEDESGVLLEQHYASADVPRIGSEIQVDGRVYRRIPSFLVGKGMIERGSKYPYESNALPPTTQGCKMTKGRRPKPIIESAKHEREVAARHNLTKDAACWDEVSDPNK